MVWDNNSLEMKQFKCEGERTENNSRMKAWYEPTHAATKVAYRRILEESVIMILSLYLRIARTTPFRSRDGLTTGAARWWE